MILTVSGWREWEKRCDPAFVVYQLDRYRHLYGASLHVRVGDAEGVDKITRDWLFADEQERSGLTYQVYRVETSKYGWPAAGPIRNGKMLRGQDSSDLQRDELADLLLALPEPLVKMRSPGSGTTGCLIEAHSLGISVDIPGYKGWKKERGEK